MKVVFIDTSVSGHHAAYICALENIPDSAEAILPERIETLHIRQVECILKNSPKRKLTDFLKWVRAVRQIVDLEQPDIVHFLMGDDFYRFFGAGLSLFSKYRVVVTLHWMRSGLAGRLSTKCIAMQADRVVVHSDYIQQKLQSYGVRNAEHIEYPQFGTTLYTTEEARAAWNLRQKIPVVVAIGNTRYDKGLDILLDALEKVKRPFQLLIAGNTTYFGEEYIKEKIRPYSENVRLYLKYLSDDELASAVCAADIIALPYRKKFDGASGPLGDGVVHSKMIVGPCHGTLGYTIKKHHLGATFETENVGSLAEVLNRALGETWKPDRQYQEYQKMLSPEYFRIKYFELYQTMLV